MYLLLTTPYKSNMTQWKCPLCGKTECINELNNTIISFDCNTYKRAIKVSQEILNLSNIKRRKQLLNLIFEHSLYNKREQGKELCYYYDEMNRYSNTDTSRVNVAELLYPRSFSDKVNRILTNVSHIHPDFGETVLKRLGVSSDMSMYGRLFFSESDKEDKDLGIITLLTELGFLKEVSGKSGYYYLTAKAWERIEEIGHDTNNSRQAFIAMQFGNDTDSVYRTIKESIIESGFEPLRIDEKEHNKQIVPEILYEINRSKFVVFDLTTPNYGAYYEAGYALGRGKEVIACCSKKSFENDKTRPHFDLVQKSIVIYDGDDDLKERLIRRITATVR